MSSQTTKKYQQHLVNVNEAVEILDGLKAVELDYFIKALRESLHNIGNIDKLDDWQFKFYQAYTTLGISFNDLTAKFKFGKHELVERNRDLISQIPTGIRAVKEYIQNKPLEDLTAQSLDPLLEYIQTSEACTIDNACYALKKYNDNSKTFQLKPQHVIPSFALLEEVSGEVEQESLKKARIKKAHSLRSQYDAITKLKDTAADKLGDDLKNITGVDLVAAFCKHNGIEEEDFTTTIPYTSDAEITWDTLHRFEQKILNDNDPIAIMRELENLSQLAKFLNIPKEKFELSLTDEQIQTIAERLTEVDEKNNINFSKWREFLKRIPDRVYEKYENDTYDHPLAKAENAYRDHCNKSINRDFAEAHFEAQPKLHKNLKDETVKFLRDEWKPRVKEEGERYLTAGLLAEEAKLELSA